MLSSATEANCTQKIRKLIIFRNYCRRKLLEKSWNISRNITIYVTLDNMCTQCLYASSKAEPGRERYTGQQIKLNKTKQQKKTKKKTKQQKRLINRFHDLWTSRTLTIVTWSCVTWLMFSSEELVKKKKPSAYCPHLFVTYILLIHFRWCAILWGREGVPVCDTRSTELRPLITGSTFPTLTRNIFLLILLQPTLSVVSHQWGGGGGEKMRMSGGQLGSAAWRCKGEAKDFSWRCRPRHYRLQRLCGTIVLICRSDFLLSSGWCPSSYLLCTCAFP